MRSEQAFKNLVSNLVLQVFVLATGVILPRFFLEEYGSAVNGMLLSINQFLAYLSLAEAGIGTAATVALYGPLAKADQKQVNAVLSATKKFYLKSGSAFGVFLGGLIATYPFLIQKQLSPSMVRWMVLVLGTSIFIDYCFLGKYKVFLQANQRGYILSLVEAGGTLVNLCLTIVLIHFHVNVVIVKAIVTFIFILRFFVIRGYVRTYFPAVRFDQSPDYSALHQRGAALFHQVVSIIVNNTDVTILTICLGRGSLLEIGVYGIYSLVAMAINTLLSSFSNGLTAGFGEVVSKDEKEVLKSSYSSYEYVFFIVLFTAVVSMCVLCIPFIDVYTKKATDVNYVRPLTAILFTLIVFLQNIRMPGLTLICAAGHYRETKKQAVLEALINLVISLALVRRWEMAGVLIGTVCSYGYRSFDIILYAGTKLVPGTKANTGKRFIRNMILAVALILGAMQLVPQRMDSFITWMVYACVVGGVTFVSFCLINLVFEKTEFNNFKDRMTGILKKFKHSRSSM